jgi:LmbE family N-acetylglucosaminyl deacetylase
MKVSVIIAAYNEAQTIGEVVAAAKGSSLVSEVIVVSDGSQDETAAVAREAGADVVVDLPANTGKGGAVMAGVDEASGEAIVLLDADLLGLRPEHVDSLLPALLHDGVDMAVGIFCEDFLHSMLPFLSGLRAIRRALLVDHPELRDRGFGLERGLATIARRQRWQVRIVELEGVSHRKKEEKYGLVKGYRAKLQLAGDLVDPRRRFRRQMNLPTVISAMVIVLMVHGVSGLFIAPTSASDLEAMPPPTKADRILLVVAHNDDELIGTGGYLASAVEAGSAVTVVILTNGDGNRFSAAILGRHVRPSPADFIKEGRVRQQESVIALTSLGIPRKHVIFMGFPDRGLRFLLTPHWSKMTPYRSPFTQASSPPYVDVYRASSPYSGETLTACLSEIIANFQPTIVITHSELDEHPDHKAIHVFVSMALQDHEGSAGGTVRRYGFVIHAQEFPRPLRYVPNAVLNPPPQLRGQARWLSFELSPELVNTKHDAVRAYRTQYESPYLRLLLGSFIRRNELFIEEPNPALP